ncbi:MAG TPA: ABC transporter permease [Chitinophagaceae bacterium]|nr:ABC transporter permease [Chitinophagaceae bacterium]
MFKNISLLAFRNLLKHKRFTLLNITGLAAGLTCFIFIASWIKDELNYDTFNSKAGRIVRVVSKSTTPSETFDQAVTGAPLANALKTDISEVENTVRLGQNSAIIKFDNNQADEDGILLTDPSFFDVFNYHLSEGNVKTVLNDPYNIILTQSMARKYFGNEDPVGKALLIYLYDSAGRGALYKVTGVMPDAPKNAHFTFNFLVSFKTLETYAPEAAGEWDKNDYYTYLLLRNKSDIQKIKTQLPAFAERHTEKYMQDANMHLDFSLQPLTSIHLNSHLRYEIAPTGSMQHIYIFATIGVFILLIACINYMNLATARASQRAKETGVKKVLGAQKMQLIFQHLSEACAVTFTSFLIALLVAAILQPLFAELSGKQLLLFHFPGLLLLLFAITFVLGILSGLYPAFLITAYKPAAVLKGKFTSASGGVRLRQSLVVLQFTISIILIAGILIINSQLSYIQHKDLGYKKDALLTLKVNGNTDVIKNYEAFKNNLLSKPFVTGITTSNAILAGGLGNRGITTVSHKGDRITSIIYNLKADENFINVYGIKLIAGRTFYQNINSDSLSYIVNEAAVKSFGWESAEDAINKPFNASGKEGSVVGVVKDFLFNSLHQRVEPLVIMPRFSNQRFSQISVRVDMNDPQKSVNWIAETWKKNFPGALFEYSFMDKKLNDQYLAEDRFSKFFLYFSILSLIIACLGLFGLTTFTVQQKIKEIGIRKILGASVSNITAMLSTDFLKLIFVSTIIAVPVAWFVMNKWLQDFAYRTTISSWVFAIASTAALLIALITVSLQAIKAATANPVKSLRTE